MDPQTFYARLKKNPRPVVVDLWAPWCGPCRMIGPVLEQLSKEYDGKVDLWKINADQSAELLQDLKVYGIPTVLAYRGGVEVARHVGAKPASTFAGLFKSLAEGTEPAAPGLDTTTRLLRIGAGVALAALGWFTTANWLWPALGGVLFFSAVYDRCPLLKVIRAQIKKMRERQTS